MINIFSQSETISSNVKYAFNQFELSLIGFVSYLQLRLQYLIPNIPVYFQNTGDFSYLVNKKFIETKNEDLIQKVPRFVIKLDDIQPNPQENTNQYNKIFYKFEGRNYQAVVRRLCFNVQLTTNFVSSNLITLLNHIEMMATMQARDNVYTYDFLGNTCQAAFSIQGTGTEFPSIDMGQGGTRNLTTSNNIELQVHLLVPRIETITLADETGFDRIDYTIVSKGYENKLYPVPSGGDNDDTNINGNENNLKYPSGSLITPDEMEDLSQKSDKDELVINEETENVEIAPQLKYKAGQKLPINIPFK